MDPPRRHLGVLLLPHEVDLGRADIGVPVNSRTWCSEAHVADGVVGERGGIDPGFTGR